MSGFLASVRSLQEAELVTQTGIDILDLKEPAEGALGAVKITEIQRICQYFKSKSNPSFLISATIGDIELSDKNLSVIDQKINATAECGVNIVKVGVFAETISEAMLSMFKSKRQQGIKIVLVYFADRASSISAIFNTID